jgi:hypothetical protein
VVLANTSPWALSTTHSRGAGGAAWCSTVARQAQPTTSMSSATPTTTASQMRKYR